MALVHQAKVIGSISQSSDQYIHSEKLHSFIQQVLHDAGLKPNELQAIAVGKGPGSYTGLRIGVSAAKGLCFSLNIPLLSADGMQILVRQFLQRGKLGVNDLIFPMIDARRMEVYYSVHNHEGMRLQDIKAAVVEDDFYAAWPGKTLHFIGDGAAKLSELFAPVERVHIHEQHFPEASYLAQLAEEKLQAHTVEDVAYFEPFYLKNFKAIKPKNPFA